MLRALLCVAVFLGLHANAGVSKAKIIFASEAFELVRANIEDKPANFELLTNGKLIRPNQDTQEQATEKFKSGVVGHILVESGVIVEVFETRDAFSENQLNALRFRGLNISDLEGKYVIPGLHDLHIHNFGMNSDVPNSPIYDEDGNKQEHLDHPGVYAINYRMAYSGVTTHLDLNSFNDTTRELKDEQMQNDVSPVEGYQPMSRIFMTGGIVTAEGSHHGGLQWLVGGHAHAGVMVPKTILDEEDPEKRKAMFLELFQEHVNRFRPDAIKISYDHNPYRPGKPKLYNFNRAHLSDMIDSIKEIDPNLKFICHVGVWPDLVDCLEEGADAVTHLPFSQDNDPAYRMPDGIEQRIIDADLTVIPTMTVYMEPGFMKSSLFDVTFEVKACEADDENCECAADVCNVTIETAKPSGRTHFLDDELLNQVAPQALLDSYFEFNGYRGNKWIQWGVDHNQLGYRLKTFKRLMDAGVRVLLGTDTMWEATFFGFSTHRELELMMLSNEAEESPKKWITEMDALKTATSRVHEFLNHNRGRIEPGFAADLVVLNSSPLKKITNTRDISAVYVDGVAMDRELYRNELMKVD